MCHDKFHFILNLSQLSFYSIFIVRYAKIQTLTNYSIRSIVLHTFYQSCETLGENDILGFSVANKPVRSDIHNV